MNGFNSDRYLEEAITSLLQQTYVNWELIFWDNCSTDNTRSVVEGFNDSRIRFYRADNQIPLAEGRNKAIELAEGEWIGFLDCDDLWLPDKLALQVARINDGDALDIGLVYGRTESFSVRGSEGETVWQYQGKPLPEGRVVKALLQQGNLFPIVSVLISKAAWQQVRPIPSHLTFAEDYWLFVAIAERFRVVCVQTTIARYRVHGQSATATNKLSSHTEALEVMRHWGRALDARSFKRRVWEYQTLIAIEQLRTGRNQLAAIKLLITKGSIPYLIRGGLSTVIRRFFRRNQPFS